MNDTAIDPPTATPISLGHDVYFRSSRGSLGVQNSDRHLAHHIFKRDACSDAFGSGWTDSTCAPGKTLCCVNEKQSYPQCQQYLGLGWCCTEYEQGCYADLPSTSCGLPGAVQCTELEPGVDEACCPQYTTCAPGYNASTTFARCNIQQTNLQLIAASTTSLAGAQTLSATVSIPNIVSSSTSSIPSTPSTSSVTSTTSNTTSSVTSSTSSTSSLAAASTTSTQMHSSSAPGSNAPVSVPVSATTATNAPTESFHSETTSLTVGAIAGIAVGPVVAVLLLLLGAWFFWRKKSKAKRAASEPSPIDHRYHDQLYKDGASRYASSGSDWNGFGGPRQEMGDSALSEMADARSEPKELQTHRMLGASPVELDGNYR